jgi:phage terminase small subunit
MAESERPLTEKQSLFVDYYLADGSLNAKAAYCKAFAARGKVAEVNGGKLLADPRIKRAITAARKELEVKAGLSAVELLKELRDVVTADPRELSEFRRGSCRYCWGEGYLFQRTPAEYRRDLAAYQAEQKLLAKAGKDSDVAGVRFDLQGGIGYNRTRKANPDCPECFGEGIGYTFPKDSRHVSPQAARLFIGVKETKEGLEIKTRPVDKSLELLMRNMGMLDKPTLGDGAATAEDKAKEVRALLGALDAVVKG